MPSPLYSINQIITASKLTELSQQLSEAKILLTQDACYNLLKKEIALFSHCYVLADDALARGLTNKQDSKQVWLSSQDWVELTVKHQPIIQLD